MDPKIAQLLILVLVAKDYGWGKIGRRIDSRNEAFTVTIG